MLVDNFNTRPGRRCHRRGDPRPEMTPAARRFAVACAAGAVLVLVVFVCVLATRRGGFFGTTPYNLGGFYDAQARALFHGHWDAGAKAFSLERFRVDGRYYTYFGPWPVVLRGPILLVTRCVSTGWLTPLSLVTAAVTLLSGTGRVMWQVRSLFDRADPSRSELVTVGAFVLLVGCGSSVIFLSGSAWVYDEAILWGAAWAVWGLAATMDYLLRSSRSGTGHSRRCSRRWQHVPSDERSDRHTPARVCPLRAARGGSPRTEALDDRATARASYGPRRSPRGSAPSGRSHWRH